MPHFTFHTWIRLTEEVLSYPKHGHRQIYSLYSGIAGLELFLHHGSLILLVNDSQELVYTEIKDCEDLIDGLWHSLTVVHTAQRSSRLSAAFQIGSTCTITIYIDGILRKEVTDFKYVPLSIEPIQWASIGGPCEKPKLSVTKMKKESLSSSLVRSIQPLTGLFSSKTKTITTTAREKFGNNSQNTITTEANSQETLFGPSTSLFGQLACVWILAETLDETLVKHLFNMGKFPKLSYFSQFKFEIKFHDHNFY